MSSVTLLSVFILSLSACLVFSLLFPAPKSFLFKLSSCVPQSRLSKKRKYSLHFLFLLLLLPYLPTSIPFYFSLSLLSSLSPSFFFSQSFYSCPFFYFFLPSFLYTRFSPVFLSYLRTPLFSPPRFLSVFDVNFLLHSFPPIFTHSDFLLHLSFLPLSHLLSPAHTPSLPALLPSHLLL